MLKRIIDNFFPEEERCLLCGSAIGGFSPYRWCGACLAELVFLNESICIRCGKGLTDGKTVGIFRLRRVSELCFDCRNRVRYFKMARAPVLYTGFIKDVIHRFKFGGEVSLGKALGWLAAQSILRNPEFLSADELIPVPIDRERLWERGYNQSVIIAEEISLITGIPVKDGALVKARVTSRQSSLGREERIRNVAGAFKAAVDMTVEGKSILLIDDLLTTGSTLNECAKTLIGSGASKVCAVACAAGEWSKKEL